MKLIIKTIICVIFLFISLSILAEDECRKLHIDKEADSDEIETKITGPLDINEVEWNSLQEMKNDPKVPQVPFGNLAGAWETFISGFIEGDELFHFMTPPKWGKYYEGYSQVRDNCVIEVLITRH